MCFSRLRGNWNFYPECDFFSNFVQNRVRQNRKYIQIFKNQTLFLTKLLTKCEQKDIIILCESEVATMKYEDKELAELIAMAREYDDEAFLELARRYTPMLNKLISGFLNSHLCYDEVFSEACFALHRAVMSYDVGMSDNVTFGLYARICIYRRMCDLVSATQKSIPIVDCDVELVSSDSNIEQRIVGRERMAEYLSKARSVLSDYEYRVFLMHIEGATTHEIANKLGKNNKSVENAKSRMFKHLREESNLFSGI